MKSNAQEFIALLFLSRDVSHKAHLNTDSFSEHMALGAFYEGVIPLADKFAEAWMGKTGKKIGDIPDMKSPKSDITKTLKAHLEVIDEARGFVDKNDTPINNIIDEIEALYMSTIYKLTFLK